MNKFFTFFCGAFFLGSAFTQNDPTIDQVTLSDNSAFCFNGSYKTLTVVVTDNDGDFGNVTPSFTNGYLDYYNGTTSQAGNTITYYFDVFVNWSTPPAAGTIATENILVNVNSFNGSDPTGQDNDAINGVQVQGEILVNFTVPTLELCDLGNAVDLTNYVDVAGGYFSYNTGFPEYVSTSSALNLADASAYYYTNDYSFYVDYYITDVTTGCQGSAYVGANFNSNPTINVNVNPSDCGSAIGNAMATITNGQAPYQVYWSNGFSQVSSGTSMISNMSSGVYYVNVTDANGCKAVGKANIYDGDFDVTEDITEVKCQGQPGTIDLSVLVTAGTVDAITWSNGMTTEDISTGPGEYSVHIHSTANCNFFGTYVIPDSSLRVELSDYYDSYNCATPDGMIVINTFGGNGVGSYTWAWSKNGVPGFSTNDDLFSLSGGVYSCTVQDGSGCSYTWDKTIDSYNAVWLWTEEVVLPTCGNANGNIDITIDPWGDIPATYVWNTGATTEDLLNVPAGTYALTYTDQSGCEGNVIVKLVNEKPYQPAICLLTVDTSLIYNMIVWEKDISQNVSGFNIYRETSSFGVFEKIDSRNYALESFYQDNDASPIDRSWRYYITTYDACDGESYPSFVHKTIHVVSSTSNSIDYDLHWDDYEGITYSSVDVFRFDDVNGWTNVANLPYGTNTYLDTPPVIAGLDYMVSFNLASPCTSTKAQDHNSSRSNKTASVFNPGGSTAQIVDEDLGVISVYPNPASQLVTLHVDNAELFSGFEITDVNGRVIYQDNINTNNTLIDISTIPSGIYFIRIFANDKVVVNKLIIE